MRADCTSLYTEQPVLSVAPQLVLIPAGVPRKPGMTRDDLFNINAGAHSGGLWQFRKTAVSL